MPALSRLRARSAALALLLLSGSSLVQAVVPVERLRLFHTHTGQRVDIVFKRGGEYVPEAITELEAFLGDFRTGDVHPFDPALFDLLADLSTAVNQPGAEFHVISAYRSPVTNQWLRKSRSGVAQHSLHMSAQAIDIRLPGVTTSRLRDAALALERGGVGYYRKSNFIHVDTGRVRRW